MEPVRTVIIPEKTTDSFNIRFNIPAVGQVVARNRTKSSAKSMTNNESLTVDAKLESSCIEKVNNRTLLIRIVLSMTTLTHTPRALASDLDKLLHRWSLTTEPFPRVRGLADCEEIEQLWKEGEKGWTSSIYLILYLGTCRLLCLTRIAIGIILPQDGILLRLPGP